MTGKSPIAGPIGRAHAQTLGATIDNLVERHQMARGIGLGVWSAIATFHDIASV